MNPLSPAKDMSASQTESGKSLVRLVIQGMPHCPSFKNGKRMFLTNEKSKLWMQEATASFVSQCISKCQTIEGAISTVELQRFLIASLPADDCWQNVPVLICTSEKVNKGEQGVDITIEELT